MNNFTKAESLFLLKKKKFNYIKIPIFFYFTKKAFILDKNSILNKIKNSFKKKIIIRSSSKFEDQKLQTNAGKYKSFIIKSYDLEKVHLKIREILKDFNNINDQIIIQEYIDNVDLYGVLFTRDLNTGAPYYVFNYDRSGFTNKITSGQYDKSSKTLIIYRNKGNRNSEFDNFISDIKRIEKIFKSTFLDIEFCKKNNQWYLFQCRYLPLKNKKIDDNKIDEVLTNLEKKIKKIKNKNPTLFGKTTFLSNMADWNPAEMIGNKPKTLALSLYSNLITNQVWATQRNNYKYLDVRPNILMFNLAGSPYIDLRTDFNSFLPLGISKKIGTKIINYTLDFLNRNKNLHDKVEFEVIPTCFDFFFLKQFKIKDKKYFELLKKITKNNIEKSKIILSQEINKINQLNKKIFLIEKLSISPVQKIFYLNQYCKEYGTLPFAGIARNAFIFTQILRSLKNLNLINSEDIGAIYKNFQTISKRINIDYKKTLFSKLEKKKFIKKYGHIRPSTYSISSLNFSENYDSYFSKHIIKKNLNIKKSFYVDKKKEKKINNLFKLNNIKVNLNLFLKNLRFSVESREYSKFVFTRAINKIFENLIELGKEIKINRNDLEYLNYDLVLNSYGNLSATKLKKIFKDNIKENKNSHQILKKIRLPDFISSEKDVYIHEINNNDPSYITNKIVTGKILEYSKKQINNFDKKIILIENADPGYDFIFSYNILGLVTKYGGANSHMAIRCLENNIPAIIGAGEKKYELIKKSSVVQIDCELKKFDIII
jgi:phosphoenolpyruvate synthase/pyruvate phosphate dikinase